ncbi:hypothetical protein, partial [Flectobacillus longus]|uniref:hypothetical protein n=1 Tax=Flectobacillus longus TaxID=2984207 RepID=UPI0024B733A9
MAEIYAAYNLALTVADSLAPEISETINNIGEFIQKLKNDVSNYVGGIQDAKKMKANFKFAEKYAETLLKDPTLPDSTRQKLSNAYQTALETKDFFCNGTDCNTTSKDGNGPNLIEELITPLCEQNKAKLLALNEALKSASNTASSLYDYTQQYTTTIDLTVLETNTDKGKLKTNECGEYLMLLETSSVGSPSLGIPPSSVLVAPKGKLAASSQFTEVELYQYILLREMYSSLVDCKTIALSSNYYIDGKYNEALYFVRSFLQEKSYMGASPSVNAQIRDRLIRGLLESTSPDLAVSAIKKYANLNAYFNASSVLEFAKSYAVAEVGGKIVLGTLGRIAKHPLIKNAVGKILSKFTTGTGD